MTAKITLLNDTISMLRQHIDRGTSIAMEDGTMDELVQEAVALVESYRLAASRKVTVLGCYMLIRHAVRKHRDLAMLDNEALTRSILEGDYLYGMLYRLASGRKELMLMQHLTPFYKKLQLALLEGQHPRQLMAELNEMLRVYLNKQCA